MSYKLIKDPLNGVLSGVEYTDSTNIIRSIPLDEGNKDYQEYLAWVALGNEADPAD